MAVIIITGASSGIGFETAATLAKQGHTVYAGARRMERMEPLHRFGVQTLLLDVTDSTSIHHFIETVMAREKRIDVLINNAGFGYFGPIENVSMEDARKQLDVNIFGMAELTKQVLPLMRMQGSGRIINTSSIVGRSILYFGGWYHVSKYAVEAFSDSLRIEVKPFGIDVVSIEPGGLRTEWGVIAAEHLERSSKGTAYEKEAGNEASLLKKAYSIHLLSSPKVVSKAMSKAVNSPRPKTRYVIGRFSGTILFLHRLLPTRWWDALMRQAGKHRIGK